MMRKPNDLRHSKWSIWPFAYVLDHDEDEEPDSPRRKVCVDAGDGLNIKEVKRLRAWLDKAIAWMEEK